MPCTLYCDYDLYMGFILFIMQFHLFLQSSYIWYWLGWASGCTLRRRKGRSTSYSKLAQCRVNGRVEGIGEPTCPWRWFGHFSVCQKYIIYMHSYKLNGKIMKSTQGIMQVSQCKPKPPWSLRAYTNFSLNMSGSLWCLVARVSSRAQVDAVGNSLSTSEYGKVAGWKPRDGGTSAPVKKFNTVERVTSASSPSAAKVVTLLSTYNNHA